MPGPLSAVRQALLEWFDANGIKPTVVTECDESALTKELGRTGKGVFATPTVVEAEVKRQYGVEVVGRSDGVRQQFFAISGERKLRHPAVVAICEAARLTIFDKK